MSKIDEIREKQLDTLEKLIAEEKIDLYNLQRAHAIEPLRNPMRIRKKRRYIAQLYTVIQEKENNTKALTDDK